MIRVPVLWAALWLCSQPLAAQENRWALLVGGISGDAELQAEFLQWIRDLHETLEESLGFRKDQIIVLFDEPQLAPDIVRDKSTHANLQKASRELASAAPEIDTLFVFIIGHGSVDGRNYKLNLPGPDPEAKDLAEMLASIPARRIAVVNATTCSGASVKDLSGKGRIVVAATKSGSEKNRTHMGAFFIEALKNTDADTDKNNRISILEAFTYARRRTEEYYRKRGNLQSEHPVLDDNGDGEAHAVPLPDDPGNADGLLARRTYLDSGDPLVGARVGPGQQALIQKARSLEEQIDDLRSVKAEISVREYEARLEELLLELARTRAKLREK